MDGAVLPRKPLLTGTFHYVLYKPTNIETILQWGHCGRWHFHGTAGDVDPIALAALGWEYLGPVPSFRRGSHAGRRS